MASAYTPKPDKFILGGNFTRFLERFEGYVLLTTPAENIDLLLLSLVDSLTYDKLTAGAKMENGEDKKDVKKVIEFYGKIMAENEDKRSLQATLMMTCQKEDETVEEYSRRLDDLACRAYDVEEVRKGVKTPTFIRGIRDYAIKLALVTGEEKTYEQLVKTAKRCEQASVIMEQNSATRIFSGVKEGATEGEKVMAGQGSSSSGGNNSIPRVFPRQEESRGTAEVPNGLGGASCWSCGGDHFQRNCTWGPSGTRMMKCWICGEGHLMKDCPQKGVSNVQGGMNRGRGRPLGRAQPREMGRMQLQCTYCGRLNHTVDRCWKRQAEMGLNGGGVRQDSSRGRTP